MQITQSTGTSKPIGGQGPLCCAGPVQRHRLQERGAALVLGGVVRQAHADVLVRLELHALQISAHLRAKSAWLPGTPGRPQVWRSHDLPTLNPSGISPLQSTLPELEIRHVVGLSLCESHWTVGQLHSPCPTRSARRLAIVVPSVQKQAQAESVCKKGFVPAY